MRNKTIRVHAQSLVVDEGPPPTATFDLVVRNFADDFTFRGVKVTVPVPIVEATVRQAIERAVDEVLVAPRNEVDSEEQVRGIVRNMNEE